jgi:hypothetical protein
MYNYLRLERAYARGGRIDIFLSRVPVWNMLLMGLYAIHCLWKVKMPFPPVPQHGTIDCLYAVSWRRSR